MAAQADLERVGGGLEAVPAGRLLVIMNAESFDGSWLACKQAAQRCLRV